MEHQYKLAKLECSESRQLPPERIVILFLLTAGVCKITAAPRSTLHCPSHAMGASSSFRTQSRRGA